MLYLKSSLGIDVDKKYLVVCMVFLNKKFTSITKGSRKFSNTKSGIKELIVWMSKKLKKTESDFTITMEATGVYHEMVSEMCYDAGYTVKVMLPGRAKAFFRSMNQYSKTDAIDAKGLAEMGVRIDCEHWHPISKEAKSLRQLFRHKDSLNKDLTQTKNRLHAKLHSYEPNKYVVKDLKQRIKYLLNKIKKVDDQIDLSLKEETVFTNKVNKIACSIQGLGPHTVAKIASELSGFELIKSQSQLISYVGYDVVENQSGGRTGKTRISKKGNSRIRSSLHFPAFNVVKWDVGEFKNIFERIYDRTKIKMKGYVAVQRKLLCIIYALWKKDQSFDENYLKTKEYKENQTNKEQIEKLLEKQVA